MGVDERAGSPSPDDPVSYFLQDMTFHGRTERTRAAYERVLRDFERFVREDRGATLQAATQRECMAWVHSLRGEHASSTVASYASYVHRFYAYMTQVGAFDSNPMALVTEEMDESIDTDPARREISVAEMRSFVADLGHPLERAVVGTLLKTGMRVGECCNLDLRDVYLDDPEIREAYPVDPRGALDGRPDSVYVPSDPSRGEVYNGEERTASNKRKRDTVVPVDDELKRLLKAWLAIRPDTDSPALFCSTSEWGKRATPSMVRGVVAERAGERGWYREGGDAEENVTPHYFRHFFTTHLRDRTGDRGVVKYLRGDVATDIIDTYTHNWGDRVRDVYESNIYSLL
ncbi:tyrosine-type recombinase/integrase [Natronomonas salina]|uniref:tyrosine-type recombinase/integrase n=1 Tax=Natronomonas salina TaxID=1710540 RepID=UPI0015B5D211|nr:tyrosine-type recombinase/integrase [Natronomonas salina]QLD88006.1 tyrosine-type recombinase/integrase [Natronomonas salina]